MDSGAIQGISTIVTSLQTGVNTPVVGTNLSEGQASQGLIGAAALAESLAAMAGSGSPLIAAVLGGYGIADSLDNIATSATQTGTVQASDVSSLASGVAGTLGGITLAVTATALTSATLPVVLGAALVVAAAALTVQAQAQAQAGEEWETPEIKEMNDAARKFMQDFGDVAKKITDALLDPAFWDEFVEQGAKIFDPLSDPLNEAGRWIGQNLPTPQEISDAVKDVWERAKDFILRRDPLTFDLDGDGLETIGASATNPILFDHDGDGIKNGTGWVSPDDAFLVLDKNSNGTIDNGQELFGDSTIKSNGQKATDGFDALADLDTNHDGIVNASDAQFANLKLWRDLNQDGISQTEELFTLASQHIIGIHVASTEHSTTLSNGNQLADIGTFIKDDGTEGEMGVVTGDMGDINLADDTFHREFPDKLDTSSLLNLPDMQGSGAVRDLREAATQSTTLQNLLSQYSTAATRDEQLALVDQLLDAWADTSGYAETYADRVEGLTYDGGTGTIALPYVVSYASFGSITNATYLTGAGTDGGNEGGTIDSTFITPEYQALIDSWNQKIHILEAFNGNYFFGLPTNLDEGAKTGIAIRSATDDGSSSGGGGVAYAVPIVISYDRTQLDFLQQGYDALKTSVYEALLLQTRFEPLLDQINMVIDADGIRLDFTQLNAAFESKISQNAALGMTDLIEFTRASHSILSGTGWQGYDLLEAKIRTLPITPELQAIYDELRVIITTAGGTTTGTAHDDTVVAGALADNINTNDGNDAVYADAGDDSVNGGAGDDNLYGQDGNDTLFGGLGDDTLDGAADNDILTGNEGTDILLGGDGNDTIYAHMDHSYFATQATTEDEITGGLGNDTIFGTGGANIYRYNLGDGADFIEASGRSDGYYQNATATLDTLILGTGITQADISFSRPAGTSNLVITFTNAGDQITFAGWYSFAASRLSSIQFADGSTMDGEDFLTLTGTAGVDNITGADTNDTILGLAGNDTLLGGLGDDVLDGGDGDDTLKGNEGTDILLGGDGNDTIYAHMDHSYFATQATTEDEITGGLGNDTIFGTGGANIYRYNLGDGADFIEASGRSDGYYQNATTTVDSLVLGAGITQADVTFNKVGNNLIINFTNAGDQITFANWYSFAASRLSSIQFADGSTMDWEDFLTLTGTAGVDSITGADSNDTILGLAGNDTLLGGLGDDVLDGGDGDDTLKGDGGADILLGGAGNDIIYALINDSASTGAITADDITGGLGNDTIFGTGGANIYRYSLGDGADTVEASGFQGWTQSATTTLDTLVLGAGITQADISFSRPAGTNNLVINFTNAGDQITFFNWYAFAASRLSSIQFADGSTMDWEDFLAIKGTTGADSITGTVDNDIILGLAGNDTLSGGLGNDTLDGGADNDILKGNDGTDILLGGAGNDVIYGNFDHSYYATLATTADDITGGLGNDTIFGTGGANIYRYNLGDGTDFIEASGRSDGYYQNATTTLDTLILGAGITQADISFSRPAGTNNLVINFTNAGDQITFFNWYAFAASRLSSIQFADGSTMDGEDFLTLTGTAGVDNITGADTNDTILGLAGNDTLSGGLGNDTLDGGADNDILKGNEGTDILLGGAGNDIIYAHINDSISTGAATADDITGGLGNDTIFGTGGANIYRYSLGDGADTIEASGFQGWTQSATTTLDTLVLGAGITQADISFSRPTGTNNLVINFTNAGDQITFSNWYSFAASRLSSIQFADGTTTSFLSTATGTTGNDYMMGGNSVADTLAGGTGSDTYFVDHTGDLVTENLNEGMDTVNTSLTHTLAANVENLVLTGTAAINGTGNAENNLIKGNSGNNLIDGFAGDDTMIGGLGNDTYTLDSRFDVVIENVVEGVDTVKIAYNNADATAESLLLGTGNLTNIENITVTGTGLYDLVGDSGNNTLTGNASNNSIIGGAGNDVLNGVSGSDTLVGGLGDDIYIANSTTDLIIENADEGIDIINVAITTAAGTYTLADNVENGVLTNTVAFTLAGNALNNSLTGNAAANTLNGYAGNDTLNGGAGNDVMVGGAGDDTYFVDATGDIVTEALNDGIDTINSSVTYTASANVENLTLTGAGSINATGNTIDNVLTGNSGINTLNGDTGVDTLIGGAGNDTYIVDTTTDTIIENLNEGIDTINSSVTYSIAALTNLENITLTGTANVDATGNSSNNVLTGNNGANLLNGGDGNDTLNGGAGIDTLIGGLGNDTYTIDVVSDVIVENGNEGIDTVNAAVSYSLVDANLENVILTGSSAINATGNDADNILTGNSGANNISGGAGNDTIDGGTGVDTMLGGIGNDIYFVDVATDIVIENANEGVDTINSAVTLSIASLTNIENLFLTGSAAINATGNDLDNVLIGNSGANTINGGAGNDTIDGGAGNDNMLGGLGDDTYIVNVATDVVTELATEGVDSIQTSVSLTSLTANVENLKLLGTSAINGVGNDLNNFLLGNATNNLLTDTVGGNDILQGLAGVDTFNDTTGNNLFDGGLGNDLFTAGAGNDMIVGGQGNDTITTGTGYDVIVFNKGDGQDIINASTGADNTISLGGNFAYSDLSLTKTGNNLILKMGSTDQITFKDWYVGTTNHSVVNLQVIAEAMTGFNLGGSDVLRDNNVENFNFANIVAAFDAAGSTANWQLTDSLLTTHLQAGSDSAAIGGDLAYQYGKNGNLSGMGLFNAQSVIGAASFGQAAQTLNNPTAWQAETVKLG